jgi:hypothetical protein
VRKQFTTGHETRPLFLVLSSLPEPGAARPPRASLLTRGGAAQCASHIPTTPAETQAPGAGETLCTWIRLSPKMSNACKTSPPLVRDSVPCMMRILEPAIAAAASTCGRPGAHRQPLIWLVGRWVLRRACARRPPSDAFVAVRPSPGRWRSKPWPGLHPQVLCPPPQ